jgi:hypothetical protein
MVTGNWAKTLLLTAGLMLALATPALAQWPSSIYADQTQGDKAQDDQAQGDQAQDNQPQDDQKDDQNQADPKADQAADQAAAPEQAPTQEAAAPSVNNPDVLKDIDVDKLDWSQLNIDASTLHDGPGAKMRSQTASSADGGMTWSDRNQPNGASAVSVKQSVSPVWDAKVGADMTVTREPTTMAELLEEKSENGGSLPQSGGSAWASINAPGAGRIWDKTAVEARIDPNSDQSRLGTSISKQMPLGDEASLTLSNGYNVTQQGVVPVPGITTHPARNYETDQTAKVDVTETGTSFSAGQSLSSNDDRWQRKIGAEQKIIDGVSVSGAIGETARGTTSESVSASYKKTW